MVDLMQETEFVQVGKDSVTGQVLYMNKNGDGTLYTKDQLKELYKKNNAELQEETKKKVSKKVKNETIEETDETDK